MVGRLAALILLSALSLIQTQQVPQQMSLTVAEGGDNLTLTCSVYDPRQSLFYWYKLKFGYTIQAVAVGSFSAITLNREFDNSRFSVTKVSNVYSLTIRNVHKEDEATYLCQAGAAYKMEFINGTLLVVNDHKNQQKSFHVRQSADVESVHFDDSVTLQCSLLYENKENADRCPDEHSVLWFKAGSESQPGFIYTDAISSDEQEESSCVYRMTKTIEDSSDAGTYYCAVATCGQILFGEGTKVETRQELCPLIIVLGTLLACSVLVNIIFIYTRRQKPVCGHCKGRVTASNHAEQDRSASDQQSNVDGEAAELNYVALDFASRKAKRWKTEREFQEDCMYAGVRDYQ